MSIVETPRGEAVFRLREHVERLLTSAQLMGLPLERSVDELCDAILETVRRNPGARSVKISAYLPSIETDVVPLDDRVAVAIAAYDPRGDVIDQKAKSYAAPTSLRIWIEKDVRSRRKDIIPPQAKVAANYAAPMMAKWRARRAGYDEILLVDEDGYVAEGPTSNVFLVDRAGTLITPPEDAVLLGVTRRSMLEIARHEGIPVCEKRVRPEDLAAAAEVFFTGTTAKVLPVASIDDKPINNGGAGPVSRRLAERFEAILNGRDAEFAHWLSFASER
jgi:branched-chain amino acid aminotransferase